MSIPSSMRFIDAAGPGAPGVLTFATGPVRQPKQSEVLIGVEAAGVNRVGVQRCQGSCNPSPGVNPVLGVEVAGEIVAVGPGTDRGVGGRVCALVNSGGYADYCVAPTPVMDSVFPLVRAAEAHALMETSRHLGRIMSAVS